MKVMIVDDKAENAYLIEALMRGKGFQPVVASNGREALDKLKADAFGLIISDILMPVMDGFQLCRECKSDRTLQNIPFIFYTATYTEKKDEEFALKLGADRFVVKPSDPSDFLKIVMSLLEEKEKGRFGFIRRKQGPRGDAEVYRQYNERLVKKLEDKMLALEQSEERFQTLLDSLKDVVWAASVDGGELLYINSAVEKIYGRGAQEFIDNPNLWHAAVHPDDRGIALQGARDLADRGEKDVEYRIVRPDGEIRWLHDRASVVRDKNGNPVRIGGVATDITGRKLAEIHIQASEDRYRSLFEASMDAVLLTMPDGRIVAANKEACRIFGFTEQQFVRVRRERVVDASDPRLAAALRERDETGRFKGELTLIRRDGTRFPAELSSAVFRNREGVPYTSMVIRDLTERKQAETEKEKMQQQLLQSQKLEAIGTLAGGVAHDFNNMLSVIIGNTELALLSIADSDPMRREMHDIYAAATRSAELTRQLLAFARKQTVSPIVMDLNKSVADMLKMLQRLIGEDIDLAWLPGHNVWPVRIDPSQMDQILTNLAVNARDAIQGVGKVTIETENAVIDAAYCANNLDAACGEFVVLSVSDSGCGMDRNTVQRIFEPFFTTKEPDKGTGLGLATVYGIVKQNNGFVNVYSEPGAGTTFKIYLPRFANAQQGDQPEQEPAPLPTGTETVLIVEDEQAILNIGRRVLEGLGYTVLTASSPEDAISIAETCRDRIDLMLTDVVMPQMNGRELAERLAAIKPGLKCIFMSGYTGDVIARHGVLEQGLRFIEKPFSIDTLSQKVREALDSDT
jgi:PAS domain S-box-containing protein